MIWSKIRPPARECRSARAGGEPLAAERGGRSPRWRRTRRDPWLRPPLL